MIFQKIVIMQEASEFKKGETVIRVNYGDFSDCRVSVRNRDNPAHRPRNHTLYDIPPILFVFQVTQKDLTNSLMMAGYCRNK
jgi:hypothetical protein